MDPLYESPRHFQVWTYSPSHRRLLLRSARGSDYRTRIDVMFAGVDWISLRPSYDGIMLRTVDLDRLPHIQARRRGFDGEAEAFLVTDGTADFVVAGLVQWHEDEGGFRDPSFFGHFLGSDALG